MKRLLLASTLLLIALPASAGAETFYAGPGAPSADPCTDPSTPCSLRYAVETKAANGDEVVVLPGIHIVEFGDLTIGTTITLRGVSAAQRPRIAIDPAPDANGLFVNAPATLRDLEISSEGTGLALFQHFSGITAERVYVTGTGIGACSLSKDGVLRDSVCRNVTTNGDAIRASTGGAVANIYRLVNVTAAAEGTGSIADGIHLDSGSGANLLINASNVIANGGGGVDVNATTGTNGNIATVALDHSNYDSEGESGIGTENVTNPGLGTNQTAPPVFQPGPGNFHQAPGSPTIDEGATSPLSGGTLDFDGEARAQGDSQDIGADEFTVAPPQTTPPQTTPPAPSALAGAADLLGAKAKGKRLIVRLRCSSASGCGGNEILVRTAKKVNLGRLAGAAKAKRIVLAKGDFTLAAGETRRVRLKLRKRGRRLFRARRKVPAKATISAAGSRATERLKVKRKK